MLRLLLACLLLFVLALLSNGCAHCPQYRQGPLVTYHVEQSKWDQEFAEMQIRANHRLSGVSDPLYPLNL